MEPPISQTPTLAPAPTRVTWDFTPGGGKDFVRTLMRELRTGDPDLYSLAALGHLVSTQGIILIADIADIAQLGKPAAAAVDVDALPTLTPAKGRKGDALEDNLKESYNLAPALIDQANDRLAGIILSRITSDSGRASLENLGSDGRMMLKQCSELDKMPAGISSLATRARLDVIQRHGITDPSVACFRQYTTSLREVRALHPAHGTASGISDSEFASRILAGTAVLDTATKCHIDDALYRLDESDPGASDDPSKLSLALEQIFASRDARKQLDAARSTPAEPPARSYQQLDAARCTPTEPPARSYPPGIPQPTASPAHNLATLATAIEQLAAQVNAATAIEQLAARNARPLAPPRNTLPLWTNTSGKLTRCCGNFCDGRLTAPDGLRCDGKHYDDHCPLGPPAPRIRPLARGNGRGRGHGSNRGRGRAGDVSHSTTPTHPPAIAAATAIAPPSAVIGDAATAATAIAPPSAVIGDAAPAARDNNTTLVTPSMVTFRVAAVSACSHHHFADASAGFAYTHSIASPHAAAYAGHPAQLEPAHATVKPTPAEDFAALFLGAGLYQRMYERRSLPTRRAYAVSLLVDGSASILLHG